MKDLFDLIIKLQEKNFYLSEFVSDEFGYTIKLFNSDNRYLVIVTSFCSIYSNDIDYDVKVLIKDLRKSLKIFTKEII